MPQAKAQPRAAKPKASAARKRTVKRSEPVRANPTDRAAELSEEVLKSLESGQRAAIDAVRKFVDTVDEALPALGERPSRRQEVIDAAMEMADRLVHTQYDFLHKVVHSAGSALNRPAEKK
jgi:hypothetical protein